MRKIVYARPNSLTEAIGLLGESGVVSRPLAGGTDLAVWLRKAEADFDRLVDISRLAELKRIEISSVEGEPRLVIGAAVTFTEAANNEVLKKAAPDLTIACINVGGPAIRNAGTIGGNVGNAAACADSLPALACHEAIVHLASSSGTREAPLSQFVKGANRTDIRPGELITHFTLKVLPEGSTGTFIKLGRRNAQAISRLSVAALGRTDSDGRVDFVRISAGAAAPRAERVIEAESLLTGSKADDALLSAAGASVAAWMISVSGRRWSTEYKEPAVAAMAERALRRVLRGELPHEN